jgi:hypothetical protein
MLEIQYTWDPAMMSVDMIDLYCTGALRIIMLEIQYTRDSAMISVDMIHLSFPGPAKPSCWRYSIPGILP